MEALGLVLLKSAAWLTGFALVYLLVLRNERYFRLNRLYLLAGIAASLLFPFYTFHYTVVIPSLPTVSASAGDLMVEGVVADVPAVPFYCWIYLAGMLLFLLRLLFQTWKIILKLRKTGYEQTGSVKLVRASEYASSFSFFSFVFVNPSISASEMEVIMNHEREHIQQRHWLDLLLVELICIVQWFNPFAWIYLHLVRQNHEYLADEQALQRTVDPVIYQAALLNQLLGAPVFSLTNSFSYSLNKKRFNMMKKKIESPFRKLKILVVLPLVAMIFYAFAVPDYQYGDDNSGKATDGKVINVEGQVLKSDGKPLYANSVILNSTTNGTNAIPEGKKGMKVKGQVLKSDGSPLYGTSVILRGSTIGAITDKKGNFVLKGIPEDGELVFSFVGFKTVVQKIGNQPMKIVMEVEKVGIDQVVVVGYGTPPPTKGKLSSENSNGISPPPPPPTPANIFLKSAFDGKQPLIIFDGKEIDKKEMDQINPKDIQSISILKDKSATSVYGDKGINGVILITSKQAALINIDPAKPPLYIIDGAENDKTTADLLNPSTIDRIFFMKDPLNIASYGEKGKNGVVIIYTKEYTLNNPEKVKDAIRKMVKPKQREDGVYVVVEQMPEFPGGEIALRNFIAENVKYPVEAKEKGIQGKVFVTFVVNSAGKTEKAKIARGFDPLLDAEALRVVEQFPEWKPGKQDGKAVSVSYTVPINFALGGNAPVAQLNTSNSGDPQVFVIVEEMPEFPGGEAALRKFIAETIIYPVEAKEKGILGKVFVTFVISNTGKVERAKIARSVHPLLDTEALRVVALLPDWKPGKQRGVAVNVSYTIPISFSLDGNKDVKQTVSFVPPKANEKGEKQVFIVVEEMPEFPGGSMALRTFVAKAIKYPAEAQKDKIQGKVFVSFVVSSEGKVEQAKVEKSVNPALDAEAIRVVSSLPDWKPGKQRGTAVSVEYTMPIEFKLQ
ncbi:MAG: TonB family protein [Prolixibacteraceae bacterium]|jgi:TonB family protein|nr:TonB family protein [Prolixibacteraceae bacterium]